MSFALRLYAAAGILHMLSQSSDFGGSKFRLQSSDFRVQVTELR